MFNHKENYYFISQDSTYETTDAIHWKVYKNKIAFKTLYLWHLNTDSCTYVYYHSGGDVYKFDGDKFTTLNQEGDFRSQIGSSPFVHNNQIHLFGGYGMFTDKNIITYFDMKTHTWKKVDCYEQYHQLPHPRHQAIAQNSENEVYIGDGDYFSYSKMFSEELIPNDFWKFNFKTKHWTKLGESSEKRNNYSLGLPYKNNTILLCSYRNIRIVDIKNNKTVKFPDQMNIGIHYPYIDYNPYTNRFIVIKEKKNLYTMDSIKIYTPEELLGKRQIVSRLYKPINEDRNKIIAGGTILGIIGLISIVYYRRKTQKIPVYQQIEANFKKICDTLDADELAIFKLIWEKYPEKIAYADLMLVLDQKISYETQKKKLKNTLEEIDYKIQEILEIDEAVFVYSKNEIDRRMKDIRIR